MTMFDPRTKLSEQVVEEVQRFFGDLVYDVIIPRTVRLSEAPASASRSRSTTRSRRAPSRTGSWRREVGREAAP